MPSKLLLNEAECVRWAYSFISPELESRLAASQSVSHHSHNRLRLVNSTQQRGMTDVLPARGFWWLFTASTNKVMLLLLLLDGRRIPAIQYCQCCHRWYCDWLVAWELNRKYTYSDQNNPKTGENSRNQNQLKWSEVFIPIIRILYKILKTICCWRSNTELYNCTSISNIRNHELPAGILESQ